MTSPRAGNRSRVNKLAENSTDDSLDRLLDLITVATAYLSIIAFISVLIGLPGNTLLFITMLRRKLRQIPSTIYLTCLGFCNFMYCLTGPFIVSLQAVVESNVYTNSGCQVLLFTRLLMATISVWLIPAISIDRFIAVSFPTRYLKLCRGKMQLKLSVSIIVAALLLSVPSLFIYLPAPNNGTALYGCDYIPEAEHFVVNITPWIVFTVLSFVPSCIVVAMNFLIVRMYSRRKLANLSQSQRQKSGERKLAKILLPLSISFVVTELPWTLLFIVRQILVYSNAEIDLETFILSLYVTRSLFYVQHSIQFYLFCLSGTIFRQEVKAILCGSCNTTRIHPDTSTCDSGLNVLRSRMNSR